MKKSVDMTHQFCPFCGEDKQKQAALVHTRGFAALQRLYRWQGVRDVRAIEMGRSSDKAERRLTARKDGQPRFQTEQHPVLHGLQFNEWRWKWT